MEHVVGVLLRRLGRRLLVVEHGLARRMRAQIVARVLLSRGAGGAGTLAGSGRRLSTIRARRAGRSAEVLVRELVGEVAGGIVHARRTEGGGRSLQVPLMLVLGSLRVCIAEKVASCSGVAIAIGLLGAPHLVLTSLVGEDGLGEGRRRGGKGTAGRVVGKVVVVPVAAKAKVEVQPVWLAAVGRVGVHGEQDGEWKKWCEKTAGLTAMDRASTEESWAVNQPCQAPALSDRRMASLCCWGWGLVGQGREQDAGTKWSRGAGPRREKHRRGRRRRRGPMERKTVGWGRRRRRKGRWRGRETERGGREREGQAERVGESR